MPRDDTETIAQWHARALQECWDASEAFRVLGERFVSIAGAVAGDVFGPPDAELAGVYARLETARIELLDAVEASLRRSSDGFWPHTRPRS